MTDCSQCCKYNSYNDGTCAYCEAGDEIQLISDNETIWKICRHRCKPKEEKTMTTHPRPNDKTDILWEEFYNIASAEIIDFNCFDFTKVFNNLYGIATSSECSAPLSSTLMADLQIECGRWKRYYNDSQYNNLFEYFQTCEIIAQFVRDCYFSGVTPEWGMWKAYFHRMLREESE